MLETNITTAFFVLLILLIRRCFQKKLGWKYVYALWLLVPLRLFVFPFIRVVFPFGGAAWIGEMRSMVSGVELRWKTSTVMGVSVHFIALAVWFVGSLIVLACFAKKIYKARRLVRQHSGPIATWKNGLKVRLLEGEDAAFLFADAIYVSESVYQSKEWMKYVVLHEMEHKRQMDPLWDVVRIFSLCFFWYNPFVWVACFVSKQDSEYSCDERVAEQLSETECRSYCKALLEIATGRTYECNDAGYGLGLTGGKLKTRIANLCKNHSYRKCWKVGITAAVVLLLAITLQNGNMANGEHETRVVTYQLEEDGSYTKIHDYTHTTRH